MHTYTVHITIEAYDDGDACSKAEAMFDATLELEVEVRSLYITDADDWAEHVDNLECPVCGKPVKDRRRNGTGKRTCSEHHTYNIAEPT